MKKQLLIAFVVTVAVILAGILLTGCDNRPCQSGHYITTMMPVVNGKTTTFVPTQTFVCDVYAGEAS
jgi:hypothetical protein